MTLTEQLRKKGKSIRRIAAELKLNHSTVLQILKGNYPGSEDTKKKVIDYINFILIDKEDLNPIIYNNIDLFIKTFQNAIRDKKYFTDDQAMILVDVSFKLKRHKQFIEESKEEL
jgi:hypothetical protein